MIENFHVANEYDKSQDRYEIGILALNVLRKDGIILLYIRNARSSLLAKQFLASPDHSFNNKENTIVIYIQQTNIHLQHNSFYNSGCISRAPTLSRNWTAS